MLERFIIEVCEFCVCRWKCFVLWFDFSLESLVKFGVGMIIGDFIILFYLKEFGCGEFFCKFCEIYFSGCINEFYVFYCFGGDFFVKINWLVVDVFLFWYFDVLIKF